MKKYNILLSLFLLLFMFDVNGDTSNIDLDDLRNTVWRCNSKECLQWGAPEGTQYVEIHFLISKNARSYNKLSYVYCYSDPFLNKAEYWNVQTVIDMPNNRVNIVVGKGGTNPYIPIEINGNQLILKNSKIWKEKPDFVFTKIK